MNKPLIVLFIIIVLFASIHFALFLDDISDMTSATTVEKKELAYEPDSNGGHAIEQNQTEEDFFDYL